LKRKNLHDEIVVSTLPRFAKDLKQEGVISDYSKESFKVESREDFPPLLIKPDLVLILSDRKKFVVEMVNPKDPKRFMGELASVQLLGLHDLIHGAVVFLLPLSVEHPKAPAKGVRLWQSSRIGEVIRYEVPSVIISWSVKEEYNYNNLKNWILHRQPSWWAYKETPPAWEARKPKSSF
jgi:hypothetical protein